MKTHIAGCLSGLFSVLGLVVSATAAPVPVTNSSFENPALASGHYQGDGGDSFATYPTIPGWSSDTNGSNGVQNFIGTGSFGAGSTLPAPASGTQAVYINGNDVYQDVGALAPNTLYTLKVAAGNQPGFGVGSQGSISLVNGTDATGTPVALAPVFTQPVGSFGTFTTSFISGTSPSGDLTIALAKISGGQMVYDNVQLTGVANPHINGSVPVQNALFDLPQTMTFTSGGIPGWHNALGAGGDAGVQGATQAGTVPGHQEAYVNINGTSGTNFIYQDVGFLQPNTSYHLIVGAGGNPGGYGTPDTGLIALFNGTNSSGTLLASTPVTVTGAGFQQYNLYFSTGAIVSGDLTIGLAANAATSGTGQIDFQNVQLTAVPEPSTCLLAVGGNYRLSAGRWPTEAKRVAVTAARHQHAKNRLLSTTVTAPTRPPMASCTPQTRRY